MPDDQPQYRASTPLMEAILLEDETESLRWVKELLEAGEDPNALDRITVTYPVEAAWQEAAWEEKKSDATLRLLLKSGVDVHQLNSHRNFDTDLVIRGPVEITILMLSHGLNLDLFYSKTVLGERICGWDNPLTELLENNDFKKIDLLKPHGILEFIHIFDDMGDAPLGYMAGNGNTQVADWLIKNGADVNLHSESRIGDTALDRAMNEHDFRMIEFLINRGANPNIPTWMWITATDRASKIGPAKRKGRHDSSKDADLQEIKRIVLMASKKFPPPTYPNGLKPKIWPPEPKAK